MKKYQRFLSDIVQDLEVKFSIYLNRRVFVMLCIFAVGSGPSLFMHTPKAHFNLAYMIF